MIHGVPFCVKDREKPFENQDVHVSSGELAEMEDRLRSEILKETMRYDGRILLHGETLPDDREVAAMGRVYPYWEHVDPSRVKTIKDCFAAHPKVSFWRWPITDEHSPEERDFEVLLDILHTEKPQAVIFNCQLGRGRTTTGMVLARLYWQLMQGQSLPPPQPSSRHAAFPVVEELVNRLGCHRVKLQVDDAIDGCSHMQNLREGIVKCLERANAGVLSPSRSEQVRSRARDYLERYVYLVLFAVYLDELRSAVHAQAFRAWMHGLTPRVRVYDLLDEIRLYL